MTTYRKTIAMFAILFTMTVQAGQCNLAQLLERLRTYSDQSEEARSTLNSLNSKFHWDQSTWDQILAFADRSPDSFKIKVLGFASYRRHIPDTFWDFLKSSLASQNSEVVYAAMNAFILIGQFSPARLALLEFIDERKIKDRGIRLLFFKLNLYLGVDASPETKMGRNITRAWRYLFSDSMNPLFEDYYDAFRSSGSGDILPDLYPPPDSWVYQLFLRDPHGRKIKKFNMFRYENEIKSGEKIASFRDQALGEVYKFLTKTEEGLDVIRRFAKKRAQARAARDPLFYNSEKRLKQLYQQFEGIFILGFKTKKFTGGNLKYLEDLFNEIFLPVDTNSSLQNNYPLQLIRSSIDSLKEDPIRPDAMRGVCFCPKCYPWPE